MFMCALCEATGMKVMSYHVMVRMCVCIYGMYAYKQTHMRLDIIHAYIHACIYIYTYVYMHSRIYACIRILVCVYWDRQDSANKSCQVDPHWLAFHLPVIDDEGRRHHFITFTLLTGDAPRTLQCSCECHLSAGIPCETPIFHS